MLYLISKMIFSSTRWCADWAKAGECQKNPAWMLKGCPVACKECKNKCSDHNPHCDEWADRGECKKNAPYMDIYCAKVYILMLISTFGKAFIGNYFSTSILIYITPSCSYQIPLHDILVVQKMWQKRKEMQK